MLKSVERILEKTELPRFVKVSYAMPQQKVADIRQATLDALNSRGISDRIVPNSRIAITAGSRCISNIVEILKTIVDVVREKGASPYIVPAMGSHGGATAEGQLEMLHGYGVTQEAVGAPIISDMTTEYVGETPHGLPVHMDKFASGCDGIIVVGRVKPHTDFRGPVESGLCKMIAIGLGKQFGASVCHGAGFDVMTQSVSEIAGVVIEKRPVVCGIAIVEDAYHNTAAIAGIPAECILKEEPAYLDLARKLMPRIPYSKIDLLVLSEMGKNISGPGMDPNVTGRSFRLGVSEPYAERILAMDLTDASHNNGIGVGMADCITQRLYDKLDLDAMYTNGITANDPECVKIPAIMPNDMRALQFSLNILMGNKGNPPRVVWIKNTLELGSFWVSEALLAQTMQNDNLSTDGVLHEAAFDADGCFLQFTPVSD